LIPDISPFRDIMLAEESARKLKMEEDLLIDRLTLDRRMNEERIKR
jgi:hypothetical protein